jgi:Na+(H+)/acetate symporter ActP
MATSVAAIALASAVATVSGLAVRFGSALGRRRRFRTLAPEYERIAPEPLDRI